MSFVKLDPETKFKWLDYGVGQPLTPEQDTKLKRFIQSNYTEFLNSILQSLKLPSCSDTIRMLTTVTIGNSKYIKNPLFGVYKSEDVDTNLDKSTLSDLAKLNILTVFHEADGKINLWKNDISATKKKFQQCASNNIFVLGLTATPIYTPAVNESYISHANILLIAKNRGVVYWIEPETTVNPAYETEMISSIKKLVTEIGMVDPTVISPVEICPQAVAKDANCMFWAYTIFSLLMLNPQERDHNVLIKRFMEKYPTKEALTNFMNGFKQFLLPVVPTTAGSKTRKHRRTKKRKTYRRK